MNTAYPPTASEKHAQPDRGVSRGCDNSFFSGNSRFAGLERIT